MINNYKTFLLENVSMKLDMVIDIIKSLKGDENKELVNRLINYSDKQGKTVLMNIVQTNNQELIDYILKFNIDLQIKDKVGRNVLFYCKNMKTFRTFYDLGVDPTAQMTIRTRKDMHGNSGEMLTGHKNILHYLSSKNLFNVDVYQKLIRDGINVNEEDVYGNTVLVYSILNKGIVQLLFKNGAKLDELEMQSKVLRNFESTFCYYPKKRKLVVGIFGILFENGVEFNVHDFTKFITGCETYWSDRVDMVENFIKPLIKYFSEEKLLSIFKNYSSGISGGIDIGFAKRLLNLGIYSKLYQWLMNYYRNSDPGSKEIFKDYIKANPYIDDVEKFNL